MGSLTRPEMRGLAIWQVLMRYWGFAWFLWRRCCIKPFSGDVVDKQCRLSVVLLLLYYGKLFFTIGRELRGV